MALLIVVGYFIFHKENEMSCINIISRTYLILTRQFNIVKRFLNLGYIEWFTFYMGRTLSTPQLVYGWTAEKFCGNGLNNKINN